MSCERFIGAITDHACGAAIGAAAAAHLAGCAACTRAFEAHRRLLADADTMLGRELSLSASPDFGARLAARLQGVEPRPESRRMAAAAWVGLAAAALVGVAVFLRPPHAPHQETAQAVSAPVAAAPAVSAPVTAPAVVSPTGRLAPSSRADTQARRGTRGASARASVRQALRPRSVEPPVIVEPDRAVALARLRELLANGALTGTMLPPARGGDDAFEELTIAPMVIPDIVVTDVDHSGRGSAAPELQEKES